MTTEIANGPSVFLFSSSWRSGSTLLQRFLTASGEIMMWGETGGALCALGSAIAGWEQISADGSRRFPTGYGGNGEAAFREFVMAPIEARSHLWIANLGPPFEAVIEAQKKFFRDLYGNTAASLGYHRYGFKETRCGIDSARQLRKLFPDARFVFLVRHPFDVMLSIKRRDWMGLPAGKATLRYYASHWLRNAEQMREASFGLKVRYEDFVDDRAQRDKVLEYCTIDSHPPDNFVSESRVDWKAHGSSELTLEERAFLWINLRKEMRAHGYAWK